MPFILISFISIMLIILMVIIISASSIFIEKTALSGFSETADGYRDLVQVWLNDQKDLTSVITKESEFLNYFDNSDNFNLYIANAELSELLLELDSHFASFSLFDLNGKLIADTSGNKNIIESNISKSGLWQILINNGYKYSIADEIEISSFNNEYVITILSGIYDHSGKPAVVLDAELKWCNFAKKYFSEITIGKTGNIYIVDENGKRIAHKDVSKINTISEGSRNALQAASTERKGILYYEDE